MDKSDSRASLQKPALPLLIFTILLANITAILDLGITSPLAYGMITVAALFFRIWNILHLALTLFFVTVYSLLASPSLKEFPVLPLLLPFLLSTAIVSMFPITKRSLSWLRRGRIDATSAILVGIIGIISTTTLILWANWTHNLGIGVQIVKGLAPYPFWFSAVFAIPAFALLNALAEEFVYRGIMQEALIRTVELPWLVLILQATAFAAIHFASGFPNGTVGYLMTFIYGIALGYLRYRTKGILAPYLAHVIADLTIGYFLILRLS